MALTPAQQSTVKADIAANSDLNTKPNNSDGAFAIAALYNLPASPVFRVWRTSVLTRECKTAMVWTEYIARSEMERDAWQFMLADGSINPSDANVRQGILDIFSGAGGAGTRAALTAIAKRDSTRIEKLLATGTGTDGTPATMGFEGPISYNDVQSARNS